MRVVPCRVASPLYTFGGAALIGGFIETPGWAGRRLRIIFAFHGRRVFRGCPHPPPASTETILLLFIAALVSLLGCLGLAYILYMLAQSGQRFTAWTKTPSIAAGRNFFAAGWGFRPGYMTASIVLKTLSNISLVRISREMTLSSTMSIRASRRCQPLAASAAPADPQTSRENPLVCRLACSRVNYHYCRRGAAMMLIWLIVSPALSGEKRARLGVAAPPMKIAGAPSGSRSLRWHARPDPTFSASGENAVDADRHHLAGGYLRISGREYPMDHASRHRLRTWS